MARTAAGSTLPFTLMRAAIPHMSLMAPISRGLELRPLAGRQRLIEIDQAGGVGLERIIRAHVSQHGYGPLLTRSGIGGFGRDRLGQGCVIANRNNPRP